MPKNERNQKYSVIFLKLRQCINNEVLYIKKKSDVLPLLFENEKNKKFSAGSE